jgi:hypothetical protein
MALWVISGQHGKRGLRLQEASITISKGCVAFDVGEAQVE